MVWRGRKRIKVVVYPLEKWNEGQASEGICMTGGATNKDRAMSSGKWKIADRHVFILVHCSTCFGWGSLILASRTRWDIAQQLAQGIVTASIA